MNFTCDKCQRRYAIADDKVRGKTLKIRCKHCQNVISVTGPEVPFEDQTRVVSTTEYESVRQLAAVSDPWKDEATRAAPFNSSDEWFAMIKGKQVGPLVGGGLLEKIIASEVTPRTYLWKDGMADWKRGADIAELAPLFAGPVAAAQPPPLKAPPPPPEIVLGSPEPHEPAPAVGKQNGATAKQALEHDALAPAEPVSNDFFKDLSFEPTPTAAPTPEPARDALPGVATSRVQPADPFAALGALDPSKIAPSGENTSFFIAQAGMNKRNPPWKIALFVFTAVGLVGGVLYALSELNVVPLQVVTHVDANGQEVKQSVFSAEGAGGLRDLLLGKKPERPRTAVTPASPATAHADAKPVKKENPSGPTAADLASLYGDTRKSDVGPRLMKHSDTPTLGTSESGGPPEADVAKVISQTQPAFSYCIEQELKRNPAFHGGKVYIIATVGSSGAVKTAKIDKHEIDASNLGDCIKSKARRMVFASFSGDDVDLEIPLVLTTAM